MKKTKTIIHVNQHKIRANNKRALEECEPVLTVKSRKQGKATNDYAYTANILDDNNNIVASVVYQPHKPLSCGARVWIETRQPVSLETDAPFPIVEN